jgi:glycosyltransferase involved in cell wall biosynthesis
MDISVIVTTVNRANSLRNGLDALLLQDFPPASFEIIVVDNGSIDDTRKVCEDYIQKFKNFTYLYDARPGQLIGWHRGLEISQGEVCCFIDDDVTPDPTWLLGVNDAYLVPEVGLATGPIRLAYEKAPPDWINHMLIGDPGGQTLPAFGLLDCGTSIKEIPGNFVWGTNFTVRKACLYDVKGFHPGAMPAHLLKFYGDAEVYVGRSIQNMGRKVLYHPSISVVHNISEDRLSLSSIKSKFITTGFSRSFTLLRQLKREFELPSNEEFFDMTLRYFPDPNGTPKELIQTLQSGLKQGVTQHLGNFVGDENFRNWVLHDNYLNLDECYVHPELVGGLISGDSFDWRSGN